MTTRDAILVVWAAVGVLVLAALLAGVVTRGRLPGPGALARAATAGPVRRTVVVLAWMWLGWHAFAR